MAAQGQHYSRSARENEEMKTANPIQHEKRFFLAYWLPTTLDRNSEEEDSRMNHAASEQFARLDDSGGDTVWFVTVTNGHLILIGRMIVGRKVTKNQAALSLGCSPKQLWDASIHILSRGKARKMVEVDITKLAIHLRFLSSSGKDRLSITKGKVKPEQLQSMRRLTTESALLLEAVVIGAGGD